MPPSEPPDREPQCAGAVLMVRPSRFAFNPQTAASNAFQSARAPGDLPAAAAAQVAVREFDALASRLSRAGITVVVAEDTDDPVKPDAVFPNNWVSFHQDGTVVLYPMQAENRRWERREEVIRQVSRAGFHAARTVDLTHREALGQFLEGTGSLVLDRRRRVAYAALSPRTDLDVLGEFAQHLDYDLVPFDTADAAGRPIYHTNVMLAVGHRLAVLCIAAIASAAQRLAVVDRLQAGGREVLDITPDQMRAFAGNVLELAAPAGAVFVVSSTAWQSLDAAQRKRLEAHGTPLLADIPIIEHLGGGGVRCMLAEIHLPRVPPRPVS